MLIRVIPQASEAGARANLKRLVEERADSYSQLSMLMQRPPEYLGRYVRQGTPKRLRDGECEMLGRYFQVAPQAFGAELPEAGQAAPTHIKKAPRRRRA